MSKKIVDIGGFTFTDGHQHVAVLIFPEPDGKPKKMAYFFDERELGSIIEKTICSGVVDYPGGAKIPFILDEIPLSVLAGECILQGAKIQIYTCDVPRIKRLIPGLEAFNVLDSIISCRR
jgi:hypothetical protein